MLPDSFEFLLDDCNAHFDWNDISVNHKSAVRFHYNLSHGLMHSKGVAVNSGIKIQRR